MDNLFSAADGAAERRRRLARAIELQNYQFNTHGMDMGQYYDSTVVIDGTTAPADTSLDRHLYYVPSTSPGAVVPHPWVQYGTERLPIVDLVDHGRITLLTGIDDAAWRNAALEATDQLGY